MPLNYAEVWSPELLKIKTQESLTSPFIVPNVRWLGAKTFHFTQMSVSGFKPHSRSGSWNRGTFSQQDNEYKVEFERNIEFFIDKADVDETNETASIQNIAMTFELTQATPENDAYFFAKVAQKALTLSGFNSATPISSYSEENVLSKIKSFISKVKKYRRSLIVYVSSAVMDKLELSKHLQRTVEMTTIADGGIGIETRWTMIDGVPIIEAIEEERFYDKFDFEPELGGFDLVPQSYFKTTDSEVVPGKNYYTLSGGTYTLVENPQTAQIANYYEKIQGSRKINVLIASTETVVTVPKINSLYVFGPGQHTSGDGYLFQRRDTYDTFIFPNGKNNQIDSIYVDVDTKEYIAD